MGTSSILDPDDMEAIQLEHAIHDLLAVSQRLADPEQGLWHWFDTVNAVLVHQQLPGRPLSWILLFVTRRVTGDIAASL